MAQASEKMNSFGRKNVASSPKFGTWGKWRNWKQKERRYWGRQSSTPCWTHRRLWDFSTYRVYPLQVPFLGILETPEDCIPPDEGAVRGRQGNSRKLKGGKTTNARTMNFGGKNPCSFDPIFTVYVWLLENGVETGEEAAPNYSPGTHTLSYCLRRGAWFYPSTQTVIDEGQFLEAGSNPTGHNFAFHIIEWHMFYLFEKIKSYLTFWGRFYYLIRHLTCRILKKYAVKYVLFDKMRFRCSLSVKFLLVIIFLKEWIHSFGKRGVRSRKRWKFVLLFGVFALVCIPLADILIGTLPTKGKHFEI